jgi:hypothetical protein
MSGRSSPAQRRARHEREQRLIERRLLKQAKRDARRGMALEGQTHLLDEGWDAQPPALGSVARIVGEID